LLGIPLARAVPEDIELSLRTSSGKSGIGTKQGFTPRRKLRRRQGDEAVGAGADDRSIGSVTGTDHTEGPL
jgi:hypothetical protein